MKGNIKMAVGYNKNLQFTDLAKKEFLLKDLEVFKCNNSYHYKNIIKHLKETQVLLTCDSYYLEPLVAIVKFYGYETVEKVLTELSEEQESCES